MKQTSDFSAQATPKDAQLCLNLGTLRHLTYELQLNISQQAGWTAVGVRMDKLDEYLGTGKNIKDAKALLEKHNLRLVEIDAFSNWIYAKGAAQADMLDRFRNFSRVSGKLGCPILCVLTRWQGDSGDIALPVENFKEICRVAGEDGIRVGLEFLPHSPIDNLEKAWDIVKAAKCFNGGIILDPFHYFKSGSHLESLKEVPIEKIFLIHMDDLKNVNPVVDLPTLSQNYRVLPGEGDFVFDEILEYLFERGYSGYYSLEVWNEHFQRDHPLNLAIRAKNSLQSLLKEYVRKRVYRT